jgi:hypothetical protein
MRISPRTRLICWNSSLIVVNRIVGSSAGAGAGVGVDADEYADFDADNANDAMIDAGVFG